ncbi:hypothetical protein NQ318_015530 [Aromia moschata]|uniref:Maturase K n=1 Tax=Aromia moschata TaxID=1265417 RepID=A0AAV8Y8L2_9CUCU|nr:hypothetical protein NQ318_015530 [Aromia moschata]
MPFYDISERSSLYRAMQQQAFYFISRKYVHDVQQLSLPNAYFLHSVKYFFGLLRKLARVSRIG